jgi:hypothetical protein
MLESCFGYCAEIRRIEIIFSGNPDQREEGIPSGIGHIGHGIRAKRSKSGAISFDLLAMEGSHAPVQ